MNSYKVTRTKEVKIASFSLGIIITGDVCMDDLGQEVDIHLKGRITNVIATPGYNIDPIPSTKYEVTIRG